MMFQVCKHDIMLPFVQEQENEQYTEMASDFRDSSGHLSLFHRQLTRKHFMFDTARIYTRPVHLKMHPFALNNIIKVFACKLKVNYIFLYIFQMYKYIRISLNWQ